MGHVRTKLIIAGLVLAGSLTYLVAAGVKSGWVYFLEVDAFLADNEYRGQRVRLHGTVGDDNIDVSEAGLTAAFDLLGETGQLPVRFEGIVPDTFEAGTAVVVEGRLAESGVFEANVLMTKCASKYDEEAPHADRELASKSETRS